MLRLFLSINIGQFFSIIVKRALLAKYTRLNAFDKDVFILKLTSLLIFLSIMGCFTKANGQSPLELGRLSASFEKTIEFEVKDTLLKDISEVVYGHSKVGYFSAKDWKRSKQGLQVTILPPSYKVPIEFILVHNDARRTLVHRENFRSPLPKIFDNVKLTVESGKLANPFYLMNGALPRRLLLDPNFKSFDPQFYQKNANRFTYLMIINRMAEIVWVHVPIIEGSLFGSYISSKRIGNGFYGIMFGKHSGYFEVVKYDGGVLRRFSSRDAVVPFAMHHDFETIGSKKLYAVGNKMDDLFKYTKDPSDKNKIFLTDTIIGINLEKGTSSILKDFLPVYNPGNTPYYTGDSPDDKKFVVWDKPKADIDFLHINAVEYVENQGVLVSFRNISKVAMLDTKFSKIIWSVGDQKTDTFSIRDRSDMFVHLHTPSLLPDGTLLLFDNAAKDRRSRAIRYKFDYVKGLAEKVWEFYPPQIMYSKDRSSVYQLPNGNFGVYFVNPKLNRSLSSVIPHRDIYFEVSSGLPPVEKTKKIGGLGHGILGVPDSSLNHKSEIMAKLRIEYGAASPGYRMIPVPSIGKDLPVKNSDSFDVSSLDRGRKHSKEAKK